MLGVTALLMALCAAGIAGACAAARRGLSGILVGAVLIGVVTWLWWTFLLMLHIVQIDPLMRWVGAYRLEQPWAALLFLTPPVVAATAFGLVAARRQSRRAGPSGT